MFPRKLPIMSNIEPYDKVLAMIAGLLKYFQGQEGLTRSSHNLSIQRMDLIGELLNFGIEYAEMLAFAGVLELYQSKISDLMNIEVEQIETFNTMMRELETFGDGLEEVLRNG